MNRRLFGAAALAAALAGLASCSSSGPREVSGAVTLNNEPLSQGLIRFSSPTANPAEDVIRAGRYKVRLAPGAYKVEISDFQPTGRTRGVLGPGVEADLMVESLPARYNSKSELTLEVTRSTREKNFALTKP